MKHGFSLSSFFLEFIFWYFCTIFCLHKNLNSSKSTESHRYKNIYIWRQNIFSLFLLPRDPISEIFQLFILSIPPFDTLSNQVRQLASISFSHLLREKHRADVKISLSFLSKKHFQFRELIRCSLNQCINQLTPLKSIQRITISYSFDKTIRCIIERARVQRSRTVDSTMADERVVHERRR